LEGILERWAYKIGVKATAFGNVTTMPLASEIRVTRHVIRAKSSGNIPQAAHFRAVQTYDYTDMALKMRVFTPDGMCGQKIGGGAVCTGSVRALNQDRVGLADGAR
jgi:hypothetical protein